MNIEISINRQPVAARSMAVRQITYKEMWLKVRETADKLFVGLQQATMDKDAAVTALRSADENITETQRLLWAAQKECAGLRGELEAANKRIKAMQQRNEQLWDSYKDLRGTLNRTEGTQKPVDGAVASVENVCICEHCKACEKG